MANVIFKRGIQANLPNSFQDGTFYLTTDTSRLYVDINNERKLLNQTVQIIQSIADLEALTTQWGASAPQHVNDFYYVSGANILAVYTGNGSNAGWVQINPDHNSVVTDVDLDAVVANNIATITSRITDTDNPPVLDTMEISASGSVTLTQTANGFEISGDKYTLDKEASNDKRSMTLTLNSDSENSADDSSVVLRSPDDNIKFTSESTGIKVEVKDTVLKTGSEGASVSVNNGTLSVSVSDTDDNTASGSISNVGIALNDGTYAQLISAATGTTAGAVYSKNEVDQLINGIDGMTYKGTIGDVGASVSVLPTTGVKNGDTYVVVKKGWTAANFTGATFETETAREMAGGTRVGDMVIAKGTEVNGEITSNLVWTYVPAGNDSLDAVTYTAIVDDTTNSIRLDNANDTTIAKMALAAGTDVTLSSAVSSNGSNNNTLTTTINHATYSAVTPTPASTLSNGSASFTAIKGITLSNGHVTGIETDTFTPVTYNLSGISLTQASSVNGTTNVGTSTVNGVIGLIDSNDSSQGYGVANVNFSSDTIKLTSSANTITMNFEWGNF